MGLKPVTGRPVVRDLNTILWFGRYNGCTVQEVLSDDPAYLVWAQDAIESFDLHHALLEVAERHDVGTTEWEKQTEYFWRYNNTNGT